MTNGDSLGGTVHRSGEKNRSVTNTHPLIEFGVGENSESCHREAFRNRKHCLESFGLASRVCEFGGVIVAFWFGRDCIRWLY